MKSFAVLSGLLTLLALSGTSHAQSTGVEYVNRGKGAYATKYYLDRKGMVQHVVLIGNGTSSSRGDSNIKYGKQNWRGPTSLSVQHGNATYRMDTLGNFMEGSKRIGNRTYNIMPDGKTGGYSTRVGNTVYYRSPDGVVKSRTVYWNSKASSSLAL
ncbi:MAG: hypothetical protein OSA43_03915 [Pirellulales bacterium]|nr:hypothetical protein [Pirellulales bacterium]